MFANNYSVSSSINNNSWTRNNRTYELDNNKLLRKPVPVNYIFDPNIVINKKCMNPQGISVPSENIPIESNLKWLDENNRPDINPDNHRMIYQDLNSCIEVKPKWSRVSDQNTNSRNIEINNFEPINWNPQKHISNPSKWAFGVNDRETARKSFKPCVPQFKHFNPVVPNKMSNYNNTGAVYNGIVRSEMGASLNVSANILKTTSLSQTKY